MNKDWYKLFGVGVLAVLAGVFVASQTMQTYAYIDSFAGSVAWGFIPSRTVITSGKVLGSSITKPVRLPILPRGENPAATKNSATGTVGQGDISIDQLQSRTNGGGFR